MNNKSAQLISLIFNPILISGLLILGIVFYSASEERIILWGILSAVFLLIFVSLIFFGVKEGIFNNMDVSKQKNRTLMYPLALAVIFAYILTIILFKGPFLFGYSALSLAVALGILDIVNFKIKASVHVGLIAAISVIAISLYGFLLLPVFFLVPLVAWSRMRLHRHTPTEVIAGGAIGMVLSILSLLGVQYFL